MTRKLSVILPWPLFLLLFAAMFWGYILNIVSVWNGSFTPLTGEMVLRVIGIFVAPLGAIVGYF